MARGSESKSIFYNKILEVFPNSFMYNGSKEIRVPFIEDGVEIQLKIVATCAKTNVEQGEDTALPGTTKVGAVESNQNTLQPATASTVAEPTEEEKRNVSELIAKLGLAK